MASATREESRRRIHSAGLRATAPRIAVLRLLLNSSRPLSHSEVIEAIGTQDWDSATLYRNLIRLEAVGLARVASQVGGVTRFEAQDIDDPPHIHPHFACRECGEVTCLHGTELSIPSDASWREALLDADMQIVGRCPACRSRSGSAKKRPSRRAKPEKPGSS